MRRSDREVRDITEIEDIISKADVCRLAFASGDIPYIVTMNFGYTGGEKPVLWFHCAPEGRKLDMMKLNNYVCFAIDTDHKLYGGEKGCDWGMSFRSITGYGRLCLVESENEILMGLDSIMNHYSGESGFTYNSKVLSATRVLRLEIEEMTCKKR
ncbi:MAG: pyridoxamine 5'-phosphate oxidase family protein [Bacteroidales bacterium]|jgi:hypothetical protein|nr:pyridoxamine 5'-phosphate oxidase family protein [Bacteroidales bacterium]MCU0408764.1 pyridoxamine 5'-phosphate oxidase family protein [Bacteroidales bacterium]